MFTCRLLLLPHFPPDTTTPSHKPLISILLYHSSSSYSFTSLFSFLFPSYPVTLSPSSPCLCPSFYHSYIVLHALRHNSDSAWFLVCSLLDLWAWSYVKIIKIWNYPLLSTTMKESNVGISHLFLPFIIFSPTECLNNVTYVL